MKQSDLGVNLSTRRTGKREFLDEMQHVVPWAELIAPIERLKVHLRAKAERPFPGCQASAQVHEGSLPQPGKEHCADIDAKFNSLLALHVSPEQCRAPELPAA
ncbi:MAG: hypothetical protein KJZ83_11600 [Burkholderiaceae bacterium]|nr:hypothetical protein [Burkholderiaceae bacterium]